MLVVGCEMANSDAKVMAKKGHSDREETHVMDGSL